VINLQAYIGVFKDIIVGVVFYCCLHYFLKKYKSLNIVTLVLIVTAVVNVIFQILIFYFHNSIFSIVEVIIQSKYLENLLLHFTRERYFVDIYDVALISIVFYQGILTRNITNKIFFMFLSLCIFIFGYLSNFRAQFVAGIISSFGILVVSQKKKQFLIYIFAIIFLVLVLNLIYKTNSYQRLLLNEESDISSITARYNFWSNAIEIGESRPFFGVGLGNYYEYNSHSSLQSRSLNGSKTSLYQVTAIHPHNIFFASFGETGFIGLITTMLFIAYYFIFDLQLLLHRDIYLSSYVISFWSLFFISLVAPDQIIQYVILFWFLRGIIDYKSKNFQVVKYE